MHMVISCDADIEQLLDMCRLWPTLLDDEPRLAIRCGMVVCETPDELRQLIRNLISSEQRPGETKEQRADRMAEFVRKNG